MKFLASLRSLCSALFHSKHTDAELDEEMRLHIQNRADDLERPGLSRGSNLVAWSVSKRKSVKRNG